MRQWLSKRTQVNLIGNQSRPFVSDRSLCGGCAKNESKAFIGFSALCGSFFVYVEGICTRFGTVKILYKGNIGMFEGIM